MSATEQEQGFTADERAAMKERAAEVRAAKTTKGAGSAAKAAQAAADLAAKIAEMEPDDRALAQAFDALVRACAPDLEPRTWYGMPAYARGGAVLCFFQPAHKFTARYATIGFNDGAALDDGALWPTAYAVTSIGPQEEKMLRELVTRAAG